MQKIALLSDIHGNVTALDAVLADARQEQVDEYWLLGDTFLPGPADHRLLDKLYQLPLTVMIRGNWEAFISGILRGRFNRTYHPDIYFARLVQYLMEVSEQPFLEYAKKLQRTAVLEREGLIFQLTHHLPDKPHGRDLLPHAPQDVFDQLCTNQDVDVFIYGHTHQQLLRYSSHGQLIINPGSIGQPYFAWSKLKFDLRAQYTILTLNDGKIDHIDFRKVAFDSDKEMELAKASGLPYLDLYQELLETGVLHTHDAPYLEQKHREFPYVEEAKSFFTARGLSWEE